MSLTWIRSADSRSFFKCFLAMTPRIRAWILAALLCFVTSFFRAALCRKIAAERSLVNRWRSRTPRHQCWGRKRKANFVRPQTCVSFLCKPFLDFQPKKKMQKMLLCNHYDRRYLVNEKIAPGHRVTKEKHSKTSKIVFYPAVIGPNNQSRIIQRCDNSRTVKYCHKLGLT